MDKTMLNAIIYSRADNYLKKNTERFNKKEKEQFVEDLREYLSNTNSNVYTDKVYDFLLHEGLVDGKSRESEFAEYLLDKHGNSSIKSVLDVGAGRMCKLSSALSKNGWSMTAIDPKIRLEKKELKERGIEKTIKAPLLCDEFVKNMSGVSVIEYDLVVGLEPCDATEHIIRQSLKYDKPFEVMLCYQAHNALNGQQFDKPEQWYEYLSNISSEVEIVKCGFNSIATNVNER